MNDKCAVGNGPSLAPLPSSSARRKQVMALDPSCCGSTSPGLNDLVIHYRNYKAELTDVQYDKLIFKVRFYSCFFFYCHMVYYSVLQCTAVYCCSTLYYILY